MRIHKNKGISKKRCLRTMGILLASVMVLSVGGTSYVFASGEGEKTEISQEKEEKLIVYLNGKSGKDSRSGESRKKAVRTFQRAAELAGEYGVIRICGMVTVEDEVWELPAGVSVRRAKDFDGPLVKVEGSLVLDNVLMYQEDIIGEGTVEGAVEKEKVHIPRKLVMEEPMELGELPLTDCVGDGVFSWEDSTFIPSKYETKCTVFFYPYDTEAVDYSEEKGWDEEENRIARKILVRVASLEPEEEVTPEPTVEPTPEVTPEPTAEPTPEVTPEPTAEPTPEATPEPTAEPTPEATPEPTTEPTPEVTPEPTVEPTPEVTPEPTAEPTPEATPEPTAESTPEVTPEPTIEPTPEATPEPTAEPTPESTPEVETTPEEPSEPVLTPEETAAAAQVQAQIDYLPTEVTAVEVVEAILDATVSYQALSEAQKACLTEGTYERLQEAQERAAVFNRQSNGVTIEGDIPWYVQFRVELKNEQEDPSILEAYNVDTFITPYDMILWDLLRDTEYKLNGQQVKVTIPAPDQKLYTQLVVVHYLDDGSVEYITPVYNDDGTMSFITTSFSPYNIAGTKIAGSKPLVGNTDKAYPVKPSGQTTLTGNTGNRPGSSSGSSSTGNKRPTSSGNTGSSGNSSSVGVPRTGDSQMPVVYMSLGAAAAVVLILAGAVIQIKRKRK